MQVVPSACVIICTDFDRKSGYYIGCAYAYMRLFAMQCVRGSAVFKPANHNEPYLVYEDPLQLTNSTVL